MKIFTKIIAIFLFVGISSYSSAQNIVTTVNTSSPNSCDGLAYLNDSSLYQTWNWYASDSTLISANSVLYNLCPGNYFVEVFTDSTVSFWNFEIGSGTSDPCAGFYASVNVSPISAVNLCDGVAYASAQGGIAPYTYVWNNGQTGSQIGNLCSGVITLTATDGQGCTYSTTAYITTDSSANWNEALSAYVYTYSPSVDGACDGNAFVQVYGGNAPFTFMHSNGDNTQSPANLCAGIYSVVITDSNNESYTANYIVANPSEIYNGGNFGDSTIVDSLGTNAIEDCILDYLSLDTAYISDISYISNDSIVVTWSVVDANGTYNYFQSYTIATGIGVYDLILQIFCPQKSTSNYVFAHDQIFFNPALAKLNKLYSDDFKVYPNPFNDKLHLALREKTNYQISISDLSGKIVFETVLKNNSNEINIECLAKGQYFLSISSEYSKNTQLIIKN